MLSAQPFVTRPPDRVFIAALAFARLLFWRAGRSPVAHLNGFFNNLLNFLIKISLILVAQEFMSGFVADLPLFVEVANYSF